jgi:hypothetical protein
MKSGSESYYYGTVLSNIDETVKEVTEMFLHECRLKTPDKQAVRVIIDAGWSHPGWWANECTVIGIDGRTGLPLAIYHVIKGINYQGTSKCKYFLLI